MKQQKTRGNKRKTFRLAWRWKAGILLFAGIVLVFAGLLLVNATKGSPSSLSGSGSSLAPQTVHISMTTRSYPNLKALTQRARLIVKGHVVGNGSTKRVAQPNSDPAGPDQGLPETIFSFQITQVLKGSDHVNQQISIFQTGGTFTEHQGSNGPLVQRTYVVDEQPLLVAGDETILFLDLATSGPDAGAYYIVGGEEGRYTVSQGLVHPFLPITKRLIGHDGDTLSVFSAAVADADK